ncbi:MAG: ATP-grasp domain-containing protein [Lachnospiraceae bacterium]|nr:ATP-grasp domain-containing protein [Lachnospiraceae bacterium]
MKKILFTGAGRRIELIKAFREASFLTGIPLVIHAVDMSGEAPSLAFCDRAHTICPIPDPEYIPALQRLCEAEGIDLLIPTIDTDLLLLSEHKEAFADAGTRVLISDLSFIRQCRDKNLTDDFFRACGLAAPETVHEIREYKGGYPAFIKPKDGSSSIDAYVAKDAEILAHYAGRLTDYVIQPYIDGEEYTIDICCDFDGNEIYIVPRRRLRVRAGEVLMTRICMDEAMIRASRAIIEKAKPCGPVTVQLIRKRATGEDYYIEINPRFGGGAPLSMKAGADSASAILRLLAGETANSIRKGCVIEDGAVYQRFDDSVCVTAGKNFVSPGTAGVVPDTDSLRVPDDAVNSEYPHVRGVIFDLDDTLYDERDYVKSGYRAVADALGKAEAADRLYQLFEAGQPAIDIYLQETGQQERKDECLTAYRTHIPEIRLREGAEALMKELRRGGMRIGILTDGRPEGQRNKIKALRLTELVDDIIITDELGGEQFHKPCDIGFRILQRKWRIPFSRMMYVGDNPAKDFHAPRQLGMRAVWYRNPAGLYGTGLTEEPKTVRTVTDLREAVSFIRGYKE